MDLSSLGLVEWLTVGAAALGAVRGVLIRDARPIRTRKPRKRGADSTQRAFIPPATAAAPPGNHARLQHGTGWRA